MPPPQALYPSYGGDKDVTIYGSKHGRAAVKTEAFDYRGWQFLCSGEQLPSGLFHATVRYQASPSDQIRTLALDSEKFETASLALRRAKELAREWVDDRDAVGPGNF